jgi:uncharacterized tellurite resistance protein B-like protein
MPFPLQLDDALVAVYVEALAAIARADGEINPEEAARLSQVIAARSRQPIDPEALFFAAVTPEQLAGAIHGRNGYRDSGTSDAREIGRALVADALEVALVDGDLNAQEGRHILRYARALGLNGVDVQQLTPQLDAWLDELA